MWFSWVPEPQEPSEGCSQGATKAMVLSEGSNGEKAASQLTSFMCLLARLSFSLARGLPHFLAMWPLHRAAHHLTGEFYRVSA